MKDFKLKFFIAVSFLCLAASCGGDDDPEASEPAVTLHLTDKGYFDGLLYYKVTSNSTNEVAVVGAESTAVTAVIPSYVIIDGKTFKCTKIEYKAFCERTKLNAIVIPKTIKEIGEQAFYGCSGLTSVTIPNSVTSIGGGNFYSCDNLKTVKSEIEKPFEINAFDYRYIPSSTLIVPKGTKSLYQATKGWKGFGNIIEE